MALWAFGLELALTLSQRALKCPKIMCLRLHQCRSILAALWGSLVLGVMFGQAANLNAALAQKQSDADAARHWAYQPILRPVIPSIRNAGESLSPIDAFIVQKLNQAGLALSPPADRRTLLRRAYLDLIGLPPTIAEIEAFDEDQSADAFERLIDRLLAMPQYGERWGRHWLDVARFAETKDLVLLYGRDRLRPYAYTYRDYVIRALNLDTPYDQFIQEQLAADQLQPKVEPWRLAALGFLTLGRLFDNNPHDQIDDQIDTVTRGFLGLTVACARCHNHKYDAIPTEDYYSLYGVFASSERPYDLPLIEDPAQVPGGLEFEKAFEKARVQLQDYLSAQHELLSETARNRAGDYLVRVVSTPTPDFSEASPFLLSLSPEDLRPGIVSKWRRYLEEGSRKRDPVFSLWAEVMSGPEEEWARRASGVLARYCVQRTAAFDPAEPQREGAGEWGNPLVAAAFSGRSVTAKVEVAQIYGELFGAVYEAAQRARAESDRAPLSPMECELLAVLESKDGPGYLPLSDVPHTMSRAEQDHFGKLVRELDHLAAYATNRPPARAMVVADLSGAYEPRVFVRGNPSRPGKAVPRRFLRVLAGEDRTPFTHGSGRLDLAKAIVARDNPLTSRVLVNRVWMHHFGEPLASSPSDFGARSEVPVQRELLDYLAWTFMEEGWSLKRLHRTIMLSRVYQQSSLDRLDCRKVDPDDRLWWRARRRRLDFESMRDGMLAVAGQLNSVMGGPSTDVAGDPKNCRRTIYGLVDRQDLPAVFRAFDFACPDQSIERRPQTIVAQQALFAMNSPFAFEQARALVEGVSGKIDQTGAISAKPAGLEIGGLFRAVLGRDPLSEERRWAEQFLAEAVRTTKQSEAGAVSPMEQLAQVLMMSNEFTFID